MRLPLCKSDGRVFSTEASSLMTSAVSVKAFGNLRLCAPGTSDFYPGSKAQPVKGQHRPFLHHRFTGLEGKRSNLL